jgi:hypothetical protein
VLGRIYNNADVDYNPDDEDTRLKRFLLLECPVVCCAMVRRTYLLKINLSELFVTEIRTTQEPNFWIPLLLGHGKFAFVPDVVYTHNLQNAGVSLRRNPTFAYARYKLDNWYEICARAIKIYRPTEERLCEFCDFTKEFILLNFCLNHNLRELEGQFITFRSAFAKLFGVKIDDIFGDTDIRYLMEILKVIVWNNPSREAFMPNIGLGKIIAYGILGQRGRKYLSALYGTDYEPDELWDANGDGDKVKKPDFSKLTPDDLIIVFPTNLTIDTSPARQVTYAKIEVAVLQQKFPEMFDSVDALNSRLFCYDAMRKTNDG